MKNAAKTENIKKRNMSVLRYAIIFLTVLLVLFTCGCWNPDIRDNNSEWQNESGSEQNNTQSETEEPMTARQEPETTIGMVNSYDMAPANGKSIEMGLMKHEEEQAGTEKYVLKYQDDNHNVELVLDDLRGDASESDGEIAINGKKTALKGFGQLSGVARVYIKFMDVNNDGNEDAVLYYAGYRTVDMSVILSDGSGYKEIGDVNSDIEMSVEVLHQKKLRVSCKELNFEGIFAMQDLYHKFLESYGEYQGDVLLKTQEMKDRTLIKTLYQFYEVNGEVWIALKQHYTIGLQSTGVVIVQYYRVKGQEFEKIDTKIVNDNTSWC